MLSPRAGFIFLFIAAAIIAGTVSAVFEHYVYAAVLLAAANSVLAILRPTTADDDYERYLVAIGELAAMAELVVGSADEPLAKGASDETFYRNFLAAHGRALRRGRLTQKDMQYVVSRTSSARGALASPTSL